MMKFALILLFTLIQVIPTWAQNDCACCTEAHRQFDFWVGKWIVLDTLGNKLGENEIKKLEDGCLLSESWEGAQGGTGSSFNYFDKSDSTWNQVWMDNTGNILKLKGGLEKGKMVLRSELQKGNRVDWYYNQISWTPNEDGTVSQMWQVFDSDQKLLQTVFSGIYFRKTQADRHPEEEKIKSILKQMWSAIEKEDLKEKGNWLCIHGHYTLIPEK